MLHIPFDKFKYGIVSKPQPNNIREGAAVDSLNWLTSVGKNDQGTIELCRGYEVIGTAPDGVGRVSGLKVAKKADGTQVPFMTYARKARYYDVDLGDWVEIGTDILPVAADGEDITFSLFNSLAGKQIWFNSPNSGPHKIMVANPGSYTAMYDNTKNYKAWMAIFDNRSYIWRMDNVDLASVRLSYIETRGLADYTLVSAESAGAGDGTTLAFSGTLGFKAGNPKGSALDVTFASSTESFSDNLSGSLIGSGGGTGTINYTTGAYTLNFVSAPTGPITTTYRWVDETANGGIANFVVPGTRVSGDPDVFRQFTGEDIKSVVAFKDHKFCLHETSIWDILPNLDDTETTNTLYRDTQGIPFLRSAFAAPEGIYTVDLRDPSNPSFVLIQFSSSTVDIKPRVLSDELELSSYNFDKCVVFPFFDYVLFSCASRGSEVNNTTFVYNRIYKTFDRLDYYISVADIYNGTLLAGDSLSPAVQRLFSGIDANGDVINNFWKSGITQLGYRRLKKSKRCLMEGNIGPTQKIHAYAQLDRGVFVEILDENGKCFIDGTGDYVDHSQRVSVGSFTLGRGEIGGGSDGIEAYHYEREIKFRFDKFKEVAIMFAASEIGYASVSRFEFRDVRLLQDKPARKYRIV